MIKPVLVNKYTDIKGVKISSNHIGYFTKSNNLIIDNKLVPELAFDFFEINNEIFVNGGENCIYSIDSSYNLLKRIKNKGIINTNQVMGLLSFDSVVDITKMSVSRSLSIYNFENLSEKVLPERFIIGQNVFTEKEILYQSESSTIKYFDLTINKHLWQFSVSELGKRKWVNGSETIEEEGQVSKIIGIMGEVLVVVITGGGDRDRARTQLIGLHTQTGELLWLLDDFEHEGITYPHLPTTETLMPDAQNEYLVGFQNRYFIEIDPQVGKVTRCRKIDDQCQIHNLATIMDSFSLQGDHLYFRTSVSSMGGFPTAIGAFNYKTEIIEWLHVFEEFAKEGKFIPINQPKAEGNRVYTLDSGGTLHIFEREA